MRGRALVAGVLVGTGAVHGLPAIPTWLPGMGGLATGAALLLVGVALVRRRRAATRAGTGAGSLGSRLGRAGVTLLAVALALVMAAGATAWRAQQRLADALDPRHENLVTRLVVRLDGLATGDAHYQSVAATVLASPVAGVPRRLWLGWPTPAAGVAPNLVPGDVYSAAVRLRQPHGLANPKAFDAEAWLFERGLRARATVRGTPEHLTTPSWAGWSVQVQRWRHRWRAALRHQLADTRWGPVIIALALGDQASVAASDWDTFSRTGIIHLVSISGLHVTLLAGLAGAAMLAGWKRGRWRGLGLAEIVPAQVAAAVAAVVAAWGYCLLAGWGVPAQRTFFMLATVALAAILRVPLSPSRLLPLAALAVVVLDPWALLAPGFWLSFGAVAVLMLVGTGRWRPRPAASRAQRWRGALRLACQVQAVMTVALVPLLAQQFHEISLVSPLANALAIPVVTFLITPLALAGMLAVAVPGLAGLGGLLLLAAERLFELLMVPVAGLAALPWATWPVAAPPWPALAVALAGVVYAVLPAGLPWRRAGWALVLPLLLWQPPRLRAGEWQLQILDVGQGSAAVLRTRHHVLVFDTGPPFGADSDAGERVVWPYLRAQGVRQVDDVVVSHADADHVGGLASLLRRVPVTRLWSPQPLPVPAEARQRQAVAQAPCQAGQGWQWDGVVFRFVHPMPAAIAHAVLPANRNEHSCVLLVQGWWHAALLPGDIERGAERWLLGQGDPGALAADVVLMAHHGSLTSSSPAWIAATRARHAVAQAGYLSRFGHPRPEIMARWQAAGASVHATATTGALMFRSGADGLRWQAQREVARRYWQHPGPLRDDQ